MTDALFPFDNTYAEQLHGLYASVTPHAFPDPSLVVFNDALAESLGLDAERVRDAAEEVFSGNELPTGAAPLAQAYAGHQFGHASPQLGDGRALLLGEVVDPRGARFDLHLKGSGRTPFSRRGDGRATLGPVLREYLMGEAMHALGIRTTRALAALGTGEEVRREGLLPGALLVRVASSHLRVGTFELFAFNRDAEALRRLTDYALARHYPERASAENPALALLEEVAMAQAELVASWMLIGFIHGVMNTDNVTISGETIDYGPCAFMDTYDPATVFSSIDSHGRYAYGNQPGIGAWNVARFAEALLPLIADDAEQAAAAAQAVIERYAETFGAAYQSGMRRKLGLDEGTRDSDEQLIDELLAQMKLHELDFTRTFRALATSLRTPNDPLSNELAPIAAWVASWRERVAPKAADPHTDTAGAASVADTMDSVNPLYIPRNHKVEEVLAAAHGPSGESEENLAPLREMLAALRDPFTEREGLEAYSRPAPADFGPYRTFCGT